jgi:hypothetical protein
MKNIVIGSAVILGLCVLLVRLVVPCPIEGYWQQPIATGVYLCNCHAFLRFRDGRVTVFAGDFKPEDYGTYVKVGKNTYEWQISRSTVVIHSGWLLSRFVGLTADGSDAWGYRDLRFFDATRIVRRAESLTNRLNEIRSSESTHHR